MSHPHGRLVAIISLLLALGTMAALRVRLIAGFVIGTILIWIPVSLYLKLLSARYGPPTLKRWKERSKTFFEWLYEHGSPKDLFNKRHRP